MIAKYSTGNGFSGALKYVLRTGKETVPEEIRVLDASGVRVDFDDDCNMIINTSKVSWDFRHRVMTYEGVMPIRKPVYHFSLSYHPNDSVSDDQMLVDAKEFLDKLGFGETQYVMIAHRDKEHHHLHIISNIINKKGKRISTERLTDRMHEIAAEITKDRGYTWGEKASKQTVENAHKPHEKVRLMIEPVIKKAVLDSVSFEQLEKKLAKYSITCNIKEAKDGKRGGISFAYEHDGQLHTFSGSAIDRQLSFGYIKNAIDDNASASKTVTYIIHSSTDASVYYLGPQYTGAYKVLEPLRQALVDRGYFVAFEGKEGYQRDLKIHKKHPDFRTGTITFNDDKVQFGKETVFGDPKKTEPAFAQQEQPTLAPEPTPAPALAPAPKPTPQPKPRPTSPSVVHSISKLKGLKPTKTDTSKKKDDDDKKKPGIKI